MYVIKRSGQAEPVAFDKILTRISALCGGLSVDPALISQEVIRNMASGMSTRELDHLAAEIAAAKTVQHPDFSDLAARIAVSNLHKETLGKFSATAEVLYAHRAHGRPAPLVSDAYIAAVRRHAEVLDAAIDDTRDFDYSYFGFKTLEKSYLLRVDNKIVERPQYMIMRVAVGIHLLPVEGEVWDEARQLADALSTYDSMSRRLFTHATPTLYNAGTPRPQMSSCFLVCMKDDSVEGIFETLSDCAKISKSAGGIGLNLSNIRAAGSYIAGTNGYGDGLVPLLRVYNDTARFINQGGRRSGSFAIFLEPWHADVMSFLDLKKNQGKEELRTRDLFLALWISDLFMERVKANASWSLFCPNEAPGLNEVWGPAFIELYEQYEREGRARKVLPAQEVWKAVTTAQIEGGQPYLMNKDQCNAKSNHQHLGTIKGSNLCSEIVQYSSPEEIAVCNLASIALPAFVTPGGYDHDALGVTVRQVARNLDRIISINFYPVPEARLSNLRHRPFGIGVQGLSDTFTLLRLPYESPEAQQLNRDIFETIMYNALTASCELAQEKGVYESYPGSPVSRGILQPDMWNVPTPDGRWDWTALRARIAQHGLRNSLLVAPMPTASTAQILGHCEGTELPTSCAFTRRVLAGDFQVVNAHLIKDLTALGVWNEKMKQAIIANDGSVQGVAGVPEHIQKLYRTVWEVSQKAVIDMAAGRAPFVCQSQSMNLHIAEPNHAKLTSMHFYSWSKGLKTLQYYLRSKPARAAIKVTVDPSAAREAEEARALCSRENKEACVMCSG